MRGLLLVLLLSLISPAPLHSSAFPPSIPSVETGNALTAERVALFIRAFLETNSLPPDYHPKTTELSHVLPVFGPSPDAAAPYDKFTPLPLSYYISSPTSHRTPPPHPETTSYYRSLPAPPALSIGVISHYKNTGHRLACRSTWLSPSFSSDGLRPTISKFFIALPPSGKIADLPTSTLIEALLFDDILLLPFVDSYSATPLKSVSIFQWGSKTTGSSFTLRSNDDVYLSLPPLLPSLYATPPSRVVAGLLIDGSSMRIPRPTHWGLPDDRAGQQQLLDSHRAWTFTHADWPCDAVPDFPQGNAFVLSSDLALAVAALADRPWLSLEYVADDVLVGLTVDQAAGGNLRSLHVNAGYQHEGAWVPCDGSRDWFFNVHSEYLYWIHDNIINKRDKCQGLDAVLCCGIQG
ncbi:hypothetical protein TeGR_g7961 [Tetraparma gracilis]|uniref:Hexosyltransferase n=1 Tax=Tetraparma gracilis TaxID=2962635 RepID=A0ABQ6M9Q7_9STRA|nr:hypothetical protein TeGR_g7961 [Tetraparma gracilis]